MQDIKTEKAKKLVNTAAYLSGNKHLYYLSCNKYFLPLGFFDIFLKNI